jgi:O-Antigen ligase
MFATPGILALLFFVYIRPQEIFPPLARVPLLYILVLFALVGVALDFRLGYSRPRRNPLLPWIAAHLAWNVVSMAIQARHQLQPEGITLTVCLVIFLVLSQGVQSFRALATVGLGMLLVSLFIVFIGLHQAFAPLGCVHPHEEIPEAMVPIGGGPCESSEQCRDDHDREHLLCEHIGLLGTTSIDQRVRYRGIMQDPNELALVGSMTLAFALALFELRRTMPRLLLAALTFVMVAATDIFTKSRSGQLAFAAVLGVYLLRRLGRAGLVLGGLAVIPILILGGRSGSEADESSNLRLELWSAAIQMARDNPFVGVGMSQFDEHQPLTAHSSVMLALGETGLPGLLFWTAMVYVAFKMTLAILRSQRAPEARVAQVWATALLACLAGFSTSALFLSLTDHYVFWVVLGLVGALYSSTTRHDPRLRVRFRFPDLLAVVTIDVVFVVATHIYTRMKGF